MTSIEQRLNRIEAIVKPPVRVAVSLAEWLMADEEMSVPSPALRRLLESLEKGNDEMSA